jgi:hypothetical protein
MLMLKNVRISYPELFKKVAFKDGTPKYSGTFLLEAGSEQEKAVKAAILKVAKEAFGDTAENILKKTQKTERRLLKIGNDKTNDDGEVANGYEDMLYIKGSNKGNIRVVNRDRSDIEENEGVIYSGCYVNAQLDIWAQNNEWGKFINCKLLAVQFWADGEKLGGDGGESADIDAFESADILEADDIPW